MLGREPPPAPPALLVEDNADIVTQRAVPAVGDLSLQAALPAHHFNVGTRRDCGIELDARAVGRLKLHRESREFSVYALVIDNPWFEITSIGNPRTVQVQHKRRTRGRDVSVRGAVCRSAI
jgi:hypothetical protein